MLPTPKPFGPVNIDAGISGGVTFSQTPGVPAAELDNAFALVRAAEVVCDWLSLAPAKRQNEKTANTGATPRRPTMVAFCIPKPFSKNYSSIMRLVTIPTFLPLQLGKRNAAGRPSGSERDAIENAHLLSGPLRCR